MVQYVRTVFVVCVRLVQLREFSLIECNVCKGSELYLILQMSRDNVSFGIVCNLIWFIHSKPDLLLHT